MDEDGLTLGEVTALDEGEVDRRVVEGEGCRLLEADLVRQCEGEVGARQGLLREATEQRQGRHAVTDSQAAALGRSGDDTGDLRPRDEGELGLELVQASGLEQLGEGDPGRFDLDGHELVVAEVGELDDLDGVRAIERGDVDGAHGQPFRILSRSLPVLTPSKRPSRASGKAGTPPSRMVSVATRRPSAMSSEISATASA